MFTNSRKIVWEVGVKLYWALEPDNDKNNDFGDSIMIIACIHCGLSVCWLATLDIPRRLCPWWNYMCRDSSGVKPIKYKEREQESVGRAFTPQY